jgi:hypothetical protein
MDLVRIIFAILLPPLGILQIPTQAGHLFRADVGHGSDLMSAIVPK